MRILCIDDDDTLLFMIGRLLEKRGHAVVTAESGEEGLDTLRGNPSAQDLVLVDFNMPGLSGLDVAREALAIRPDLRVVIASGFITDALRQDAQALGVAEVIFKPDTVTEYCEAVEKAANLND
jgi:CheY-like chemotaxis protein